MRHASKTRSKADDELSSSIVSSDVKEERLNQSAEGFASSRDLELRKKEASKRIYLTRYE